jgi:O-antigen ligase
MPLRPLLIFLFITLPWLTPFAPGPSPAVMPWLVALMASAALMIFSLLPGDARGATAAPAPLPFAARWAAPFAWALLVAGVLSSVMGLLQYFGVAEALEPWVKQGKFGEAYANLRQRNQFASLTNMALVAALWLAYRAGESGLPVRDKAAKRAGNGPFHEKTRHQELSPPIGSGWQDRFFQVGLIAGGVILAAGNAASLSRTGLLQLAMIAVLLALWGGWRNRHQRWIYLFSVATYAAGLFALPYLAGFDMSEQGMLARLRDGAPPCSSRFTLWSNVLHLIAQKPWLGWGLGELDYAHYMTLYGDDMRFCEILDNAHNLPLHVAVELGVPAALLASGAIVLWVLRRQPWAERDGTRQMAWGVLAVIGLHSLLEYPLWYGPFQMAAVLCVGILWQRGVGPPAGRLAAQHAGTAEKAEEGEKELKYDQNQPVVQWSRASIAITLIAFALYATWDYHRISQIYLPVEQRDPAYAGNAMGHARKSRLFRDQVEFAELTITPVTPDNAKAMFISAHRVLHYSPEPRVIEKAIESSVALGLDDDALMHLARFRAAFPKEHATWARGQDESVSARPETSK